MRLVRSMRFRSTCSRFSFTGSLCQSTIITGVSSPPCTDKLKMVLWPVLLCRILFTSLGFTATATAGLLGAVQYAGRQSLHAQTAGFILAARLARLGANCNIFSHLFLVSQASPASSVS